MVGRTTSHCIVEDDLVAVELCDPLRHPLAAMERVGACFLHDIMADILSHSTQARLVADLVESVCFERPASSRLGETVLAMLRDGSLHARLITPSWVEELRGWDRGEEPQPLLPPDDVEIRLKPSRLSEQPRITWVSFEVVDDRGVAAEGTFRIALDARVISGNLEQQAHRYDDLREAVDVLVRADDLHWQGSPHSPAPPTVPPPTAAPAELSFEVVDDEGRPMTGEFQLDGTGKVLASGSLRQRKRVVIDPAQGPFLLSFPTLHCEQDQ